MLLHRIEVILLAFCLGFPTACQRRETVGTDQSTIATTSTPETTTGAASTASTMAEIAPPHSVNELQEVTTRIYKEAVIVDGSRNDNFVVGDFNGDGSQDIAVIVKPGKGMLAELNSEYANWIREDAFEVGKRAAHAKEQQPQQKRKPTVITAGDHLLAVIHGHQAAGWRNPMATQTYLVKNAVGEKVTAQTARSLLNDAANRQQLPPLRGDVIRETLAGTPGFIYWTGARYAWHPATN